MTDTVPAGPEKGPNHIEDAEQVAERVAAGLPVTFDMTFPHRAHGRLQFTGELPLADSMMRHRVAMDNRLDGLAAEPSMPTLILAAALAGFDCGLLKLPVIREDRTEVDDPERGSMKVELVQVSYDPGQETDIPFLVDVWQAFSTWRASLAAEDTVRAVGNASGVTPGNA